MHLPSYLLEGFIGQLAAATHHFLHLATSTWWDSSGQLVSSDGSLGEVLEVF